MPVPTIQIPNPLIYGDYDTRPPIRAMDDDSPHTLTVKLGRKTPKARPPAPRFASYLKAAGSPPPAETNRRAKAMDSIRRMYLNDRFGDCVVAGKYHLIGLWSGNDGPQVVLATDNEVYQQYQQICGPGDNGCNVTDVLDAMKSRGLPCNGVAHKIDGYVAVDWRNKLEVMVAIYLFGGLTLAIDLPAEWEQNPTTWATPQRNIVGGHDISAVDYNADGVVIATWAGTRLIPWPTFTTLNSNTELYAALSPDWYGNDNLAPMGVDVLALKVDLQKLGGGQIPDIDPTPVPVPPGPTPTPPGPTPDPGPTPTPPVPVPTPPAPVVAPNYALQLQGYIPGPFGRQTAVTLTGTATPNAAHSPAAGLTPEQWQAIIQLVFQLLPIFLHARVGRAPTPVLIADFLALYAAYQSHDPAAIAAAALQLANDLKK